jgi:REP element-mobilizing transposase RayT
MSRGVRKEPIFVGDGDRVLFLELLGQVVARRRWRIFSYCLMLNHYHVVLQTHEPDLPSGMRVLNGEYAQWFNATHGLSGHVFERRFQAVLVEGNGHFLELSRYLALNPVRAGLCAHPSEWVWGSYSGIVGGRPNPLVVKEELLAHFGADSAQAREALRRFVEDGSPHGS